MKLLAKFDFGNEGTYADKGFIKLDRIYKSPCYMWMGDIRNKWFQGEHSSPYRDIVFYRRGEFRVGLTPGKIRLVLHFYDMTDEHAPFPVYFSHIDSRSAVLGADKTYAFINVVTAAGKETEKEVCFDFDGGALAVSFPSPFFISGLDIYSDTSVFTSMYPEAVRLALPKESELENAVPLDKKEMFFRICDFLLDSRSEDGFVGDFEFNKKLWYTSSYPIRAWLCAYSLSGDGKYLAACENILDKFVSEQMPEGSFTQVFRNRKTSGLSDEELEDIRQNNWMNLADVGSMVAALVSACKYTGAERKEVYLASAKRYIDSWAMRFCNDCGGFTNGWVCRPAEKLYSVATASTALTCVFLYELTGEEKYMETAENAALFMAKDWKEDGRMIHYVYDRMYPGHDFYQNVCEFADGFYTAETLSAVLAASHNDKVRKAAFSALEKYVFGSEGLLELKKGLPWWEMQNIWHNSKSTGNPIFLLDCIHYGKEFELSSDKIKRAEDELSVCEKFLCTPEFAVRLGVMMPVPEGDYPFPNHALQGWAGCSVAATGFCGIALSDMIKKNIIYLK